MALECDISVPSETSCCACRDRSMFVAVASRLLGYCSPCRGRWTGAAADTLPPEWTMTAGDLLNEIREGSLVVSHPREDALSHRNMFDEGSRYGPPRYGREEEKSSRGSSVTRRPLAPLGSNAKPPKVSRPGNSPSPGQLEPARATTPELRAAAKRPSVLSSSYLGVGGGRAKWNSKSGRASARSWSSRCRHEDTTVERNTTGSRTGRSGKAGEGNEQQLVDCTRVGDPIFSSLRESKARGGPWHVFLYSYLPPTCRYLPTYLGTCTATYLAL